MAKHDATIKPPQSSAFLASVEAGNEFILKRFYQISKLTSKLDLFLLESGQHSFIFEVIILLHDQISSPALLCFMPQGRGAGETRPIYRNHVLRYSASISSAHTFTSEQPHGAGMTTGCSNVH